MNLLTASQLTKTYGDHIILNHLNFHLEKNKCIALIGPNGAGKTTTLRILTGLMKQTSGTVQFLDSHKNDFRLSIGYLPQHPVFYNWMSGLEYLIYCARLSFIKKREAKIKAKQLLEKVGLLGAQHKRIDTYSGGMKQRLGIAQAIIHHPKLLILDEPVTALDPIGRREVLTLMDTLKREMTILFSTHILSDAEEISDELILMQQGKIVEAGSMENLRKKYQTLKIELTFSDDLLRYKDEIMALDSVITATIERNVLHVNVDNIEQARQEILRKVSTYNWPLTQFTVNRISLEDMFLKVVS